MELAVWNIPPAEFLVSGITSGAASGSFQISRMRPEECTAQLVRGAVDVALVPTTMALQGADGFEIIPGVSFSTWKYPYASLVLKHGLGGSIETVAYDRRARQEQIIAQIILHEHYGADPDFVAFDKPAAGALLRADTDAALVVGEEAPLLQTEHLVMDLGQEWFELAQYPMVWGLLAARKGTLEPSEVQALIEAVRAAEHQRKVWTQARETPVDLNAFYQEDLRLRFDDLATASLTTLKEYLFFYNVLSEIPSFSYARTPAEDEEAADSDQQPLL